MKNKKKRNDVILISVLLAVSAVCFAAFSILHRQKPAVSVEISINGRTQETLDLMTDCQHTIQSPDGGTNLLIIENGTARISDANCPDKLCVHQGKISQSGEMLVCLPHKVIVSVAE